MALACSLLLFVLLQSLPLYGPLSACLVGTFVIVEHLGVLELLVWGHLNRKQLQERVVVPHSAKLLSLLLRSTFKAGHSALRGMMLNWLILGST